jgi:ArsR family transcriptional regulator, arsenate/arsenite/antimonite-responsive transcriptional repressor
LTDQWKLIYISPVSPTTAAPDLDRAVVLFHALSDATRLSILEMLRGGERCVCELQDELDAAQSRLSFHLRVLREAGLVADRKEGRWSYYRIVPHALTEVHDLAVALQPTKGALPVLRAGSCCG